MSEKIALLSVWDKTGIREFAEGLAELGWTLLSTGGTARTLREAGLTVVEVSDWTGSPEILGGRVKTLHPKIHAGILQRADHPDDVETCRRLGYPPIGLVCVNLYPFPDAPSTENIDIGGPTMLRAAAKNRAFCIPVIDPKDYPEVLSALRAGDVSPTFRDHLAAKVFDDISHYDDLISLWLYGNEHPGFVGYLPKDLRYGENPHQKAQIAPISDAPGTLGTARILHGKEMSYNNFVDADAALETVRELYDSPAAVVVKHGNPCGAATGETLAEALAQAWEGDAVSAYGSVIALSRPVDLAAAQVLQGRFVEALIAPSFEPDALEWLRAKSKMIRLVSLDAPLAAPEPRTLMRQIRGAMLYQDADVPSIAPEQWEPVTRASIPDALRPLASFGVRMCAHLKSNAILLAYEYRPGLHCILGMGAGQPNRVDAMRKLALPKATENMERLGLDPAETMARTVLVSDAFFPFADNIEAAAAAGVRHIVAPGGSKRDAECIAAADAAGIAMVFTHCRHFLH
jgi:phosphoribosylaminoimidazolecarboxamide formyltransferase/IMP cyclohydrolase